MKDSKTSVSNLFSEDKKFVGKHKIYKSVFEIVTPIFVSKFKLLLFFFFKYLSILYPSNDYFYLTVDR